MNDDVRKLSPNEEMKTTSRGLRGTVAEEFSNALTGQISPTDQQLIKFHGIYQQDDRDRRTERERKKLEPAYSYMVRLRIPGGDITPTQWLQLQECAEEHANGIIKITTRQTVQFHGIVKSQMKPSMKWFDHLNLDSIAACGDVNRNVMSGSNPELSDFHSEVHAFADKISEHLLPTTKALTEIWLDGEKLEGTEPEPDPLYQDRYLPRKFKIGIAIPPHNETDIFTQDIGLIAIEEDGVFTGFNVAIGGGLGTTHGNPQTYPRLGDIIGFASKDQVLDVCWQIAAVQRDFGNREDRKQARLKYTIDRIGLDVFKAELESRLGYRLGAARDYPAFTHRGDVHEWLKDSSGHWNLTLYVENGRVRDIDGYAIKTALKALSESGYIAGLRFTGNQNVMLTGVDESNRAAVEKILAEHGITIDGLSETRKHSLACVAMPTCPLALAEAQRYLPDLLTKIESLQQKHGLAEQLISVRMTGCPNGCARPYVAEVGLIGKSAGHYNLMLGGDALGTRLNTLYREEQNEEAILNVLDELFASYAAKRADGEGFGDYVHRTVIAA